MPAPTTSKLEAAGLLLGPALFLAVLLLPPAAGMSLPAQRVAALTCWMATWWLSTPVPLEATALLPLVCLPALGVSGFDRAAGPYANPVIFLFMGGFFIAAAMERWNLHQRVAYGILRLVGTDERRVVLAFMLATGFISMWISNTATSVMMMPMAIAVLALAKAEDPGGPGSPAHRHGAFGTALVLGIAYSASIGGMATLIGTPPNAIFAAAAKQLYGTTIGFGEWMRVGLPIALVMLPACWWLLAVRLFPCRGPIHGLGARLDAERAGLGPLRGGERFTLIVFVTAVAAWVLRDPKVIGAVTIPGIATFAPAITDSVIAIGAALVLFIVPFAWSPRGFALDWPTASRAPWGMLLLFGGGLSLAEAFQSSGLSEWIGALLSGMAGQPKVIVVAVVATVFVALSELASNAAVAAMAMPLLSGIAPAVGQPPLLLMQVAALASSISFLLPVSTPPNTVAFATGEVSVRQMAKAGIWLDIMSIVLLTVVGTWLI